MDKKWWLLGGFLVGGLGVALALALFASPFASRAPDGMGRVAIDKGLPNERVSTGLAGAIGVVLTFAIGVGVFSALRVARNARAASRQAGSDT
jgi:multisubunit Na+/H+ antiporter MnhB subunit